MSGQNLTVLSTKRIEALTDGIFAIAMTLLVLNIDAPSFQSATQEQLRKFIMALYPEFINFALSFLLLAIFWIVHHRQFHFIKRSDERLLWINIFILMSVAFIPFSASLVEDFSNVQTAVLIFDFNLLVIGLLFFTQWYYATTNHRLTDPDISDKVISTGKKRSLVIPVVSLIAMGVSFISPGFSTAPYALVPFILLKFPRQYEPHEQL